MTPKGPGLEKIDTTKQDETRQISAVGSIRTIQELPGEEGGGSSMGANDGVSQFASPEKTLKKGTRNAQSKLSLISAPVS